VRFRTDDTVTKSGFAATYLAYDRPDSEELIEREQEVDSRRTQPKIDYIETL
jgi:hypothetical protein